MIQIKPAERNNYRKRPCSRIAENHQACKKHKYKPAIGRDPPTDLFPSDQSPATAQEPDVNPDSDTAEYIQYHLLTVPAPPKSTCYKKSCQAKLYITDPTILQIFFFTHA